MATRQPPVVLVLPTLFASVDRSPLISKSNNQISDLARQRAYLFGDDEEGVRGDGGRRQAAVALDGRLSTTNMCLTLGWVRQPPSFSNSDDCNNTHQQSNRRFGHLALAFSPKLPFHMSFD